MKKFKYKYPVWIKIIIIVAIILAVASLVLNIYRLIKANGATTYDYMSFTIAVAISLAGGVLFTAMLVSSGYKVDDNELTLYWGFLKNKLPIKAMKKIVFEQTSEKLVIYYNEDNFFVLNGKTCEPLELVDELRKRNDKIIFELTSTSVPPEKSA